MYKLKVCSKKRHTQNNNAGMSLVELLISVCIFAIMALGFSSMDTFIHYQVSNSDMRTKMQSEVSYVLEHMTKNMIQAVGNTLVTPSPVSITTSGSDTTITVWIDYNSDGKLDAYPTDRQIAYQFKGSPTYEMWYYPDYIGSVGSHDVIGAKIYSFTGTLTDDYLFADIVACWNPTLACGSAANPSVEMKSNIHMPGIGAH